MKYFPLPSLDEHTSQGVLRLTEQSTTLLIEISKNLKLPLQPVHLSLWLFHCQTKIMTFCNFDRFAYVCAAILVAGKVSEHLRNPQDILHQMRNILKKKKNITKEDNEQTIKRWMKKIFQAEVNIMINIGFQFQIDLGIHYLNSNLKQQIKDISLIDKVKATLTSFYMTQLVLYFDYEILALTALEIVMKNQGINIQLYGLSDDLKRKLNKDEIKEVKSFFINKCSLA